MSLLAAIFSACLVTGIMVRKIGLVQIARDQGIFLYTAEQILEGGMPYLDSWDHKGPVTYLLNALWILMGGSVTSAALAEAIFLTLTLFLFFFLVLRRNRMWATFFICIFGLTYFLSKFHESWGLTETITMPLVFLGGSLLIIYASEKSDRTNLLAQLGPVFLGSIFCAIVLARPSNGFGFLVFSVGFLLVYSKSKSKVMLKYSFGFFLLLTPVILWIQMNGAGPSFWEQFIRFNYYYSKSATFQKRLDSIESTQGFILFAAFISLYFLFFSHRDRKSRFMISLSFLAITTDLLMSSASGRGYPHYFVVPVTTAFLAFFVLIAALPVRKSINLHLLPLLVAVMVFSFSILQFIRIPPAANYNEYLNAAQYISDNTKPEDAIYFYGAETGLLAVANRTSASPITYFYPLTAKFYPNAGKAQYQLLGDLIANSPKMIITRNVLECEFDQIVCQETSGLYSENQALLIRKFIREKYLPIIEIDGFRIFKSRVNYSFRAGKLKKSSATYKLPSRSKAVLARRP